MISLESSGTPGAYSDRPPDAALAFVRICTHYFSHGAWLEEGELIAGAGQLAGIPGVLLHGRHEVSPTARSKDTIGQFAASRRA